MLALTEKTITQLNNYILSLDDIKLCKICSMAVLKGLKCNNNGSKTDHCDTSIHDVCFQSLCEKYKVPKCPTCLCDFEGIPIGPEN